LNWLIFGITSQNASLAVAWLLLLFGLIRIRRGQTWMTLLPVVWVLLSIVLFLTQGLFRPNNLKFLLPAQIGIALWLGRGVWVLWQGLSLGDARLNRLKWLPTAWIARLAAIAAALTLVFALYQGLEPLYHDPAYQRADYRAIAARAAAELSPNDVIILNGPNQAEVFDYYYDGVASVYGLPPGLGGNDAQTLAETQAALTGAQAIYAIFWGDAERDPNHVVELTLDHQAYLVDDTWYGDVRLARYLLPGDMSVRDLDVSFEQGIRLIGVRWSDAGTTLAPGDAVLVALEWRAETVQTRQYKVFVQLLYPDGTLATQHDGEPVGNSLPTTAWQLGEIIEDHHALYIPTDAPAGDYTLIVGLYAVDPPYERLLTSEGEDHVEIAQITVR
ncbi:MAG: hypothetical protein KC547_15200, partial [Anaerolineae bacterium]|nr:hypothetical protein [Anaerolineae bacterium]